MCHVEFYSLDAGLGVTARCYADKQTLRLEVIGLAINKQATIYFPCQKCGHKEPLSIGWLDVNREFTCPECETVHEMNGSDLVEELKQITEKAANDLRQMIRDANRKLK